MTRPPVTANVVARRIVYLLPFSGAGYPFKFS
jgi:hypothetical protein